MTLVVFDHMATCPKCKLLLRDMIKAHFMSGAVSNPLSIYARWIDPIKRGNLWTNGPLPLAPSSTVQAKFVAATPQIHVPASGKSIYVARMVASDKQVFESTSYFMQYVFARTEHDFQPPLVSSLTSRFNKEVLDTAQKLLGKQPPSPQQPPQ